MTHTYDITGMSCQGCATKVRSTLLKVQDVSSVEVDKSTDTASITMAHLISEPVLDKALKQLDPKYAIKISGETEREDIGDETRSWIATYKPILLIFFYITLITLLVQYVQGDFDLREWMRHFMAGFFLTFSFFKMMDLSGFADSYKSYDLIARHWSGWGFVYAFIELGLGIAYLLNCCPLATNLTAFVVMTLSIVGVLQSVLNKRKIQCACLGAVFDLPMSTVTIIEDALMIAMSGFMIWSLLG